MPARIPLKLNASNELARFVDGDVVARSALIAPRFKARRKLVHPYCAQGVDWVAGAAAAAPTGHPAHSYPFMVPTQINYEGHPHYNWRRLEANLSDGNTPAYNVNGYEAGDFIAAGDFIRGRRIVYDLTCRIYNSINADAFFEFVLEPNPVAGTYDGANRMRMLSDELGMTWSGERMMRARIELCNEGRTAYSWHGAFSMYHATTGAKVWAREVGGFANAGHDFLVDDAILQLRWRVDRIANIDTYNTTYQGLSTLKLAVRSIRCEPEGL